MLNPIGFAEPLLGKRNCSMWNESDCSGS